MNYITIDGITCSGKSLYAKILLKKNKKKEKKTIIIAKDLFLKSRLKRIRIAKNLKKNLSNQNQIHYNQKKIKDALNFLRKKNKSEIYFQNLYDRKTGKNILEYSLSLKKIKTIIYEGIYVNEDLKNFFKPNYKILIVGNVYESLKKKIERIRDKKILIQNVVEEFIRIHLKSFLKYLKKENFDTCLICKDKKFFSIKNGKNTQIKLINNFLEKHAY